MDEDLYKPFKLCFLLFKTFGMWHDGKQSWSYLILGYLAHFICIEVYVALQFIYVFKADNLIDSTEALSLAVTDLAMLFKCWNFFHKLKKIIALVDYLEALLKFSYNSNEPGRFLLRSQVKFGYKVFIVFWSTVIMTCITSFFPPFITHQLPYKIWFPFDYENSEVGFWSACALMLLNSPYISTLDLALDILPIIFMTFAIGLLDELAERLEKIGSKGEKPVQELVHCVEVHKKIKVFIRNIEKNFSTTVLMQGVLSSAILCTSAFTMSSVNVFNHTCWKF